MQGLGLIKFTIFAGKIMGKYIGIFATVSMVAFGLYVIYRGFESKLSPVKEATPEAKFNRRINFVTNG